MNHLKHKTSYIGQSLVFVLNLILLLTTLPAHASEQTIDDITAMNIEDLLQKEVVTASKIAQQVSNSPSAVSIVTAKDIQTFGYRALAEIIDSMRGLNTISDNVYTYMSGRGFGRPGDYPGRVMLLIDGHQANDGLYNASYLGTDGLLDTELIERVEYVSGPGGVTYGNGAFYGIINVITKNGNSFNGGQVAIDLSSQDSYKQRFTFGKALNNGAEILFSASSYQSQGRDYYVSAFDTPENNFGVATHDADKNKRMFFKGQYENWGLSIALVDRKKEDPFPSFGADFNAQPSFLNDSSAFVNLKYEDNIRDNLSMLLRTYVAGYDYEAQGVYSGEHLIETNSARWFGLESKFVYSGIDRHTLVYGVEARKDYKLDFYLSNGNNIENSSHLLSAYLQDEYQWSKKWTFNLGARADFGGFNANFISPRVAAIYKPIDTLTLKASYASAFRRPNPFEKFYDDDGSTQSANPDLKKEVVEAKELVVEYTPDETSKLIGSVYHYVTKNLIEPEEVALDVEQFFNVPEHQSKGFDIEYNKKWANSASLRLSYSWQYTTHEDGEWISNSPKHLAKLNLSYPMFTQRARAGLEVRYIGQRLTESQALLDDYTVVNLSASSRGVFKNTNVTASVKNVFNTQYLVPAPTFYPVDSFEQDGRTFWLQLSYDFK